MQVVANMFEVSAKQVRDIWERKLALSVTGLNKKAHDSKKKSTRLGAQARTFRHRFKEKNLLFLPC